MFDDDRYGFGFGWFWHIASFIGGLILTTAVIVVAVLLVRYLIVATRAAQFYLDTHDTARPARPVAAPAAQEPPPATPAPKTAPRPRTPKAPPG
jgi:hypothetical protein